MEQASEYALFNAIKFPLIVQNDIVFLFELSSHFSGYFLVLLAYHLFLFQGQLNLFIISLSLLFILFVDVLNVYVDDVVI